MSTAVVDGAPTRVPKARNRIELWGLWTAVLAPSLAPLLIIPFVWQRWVNWRDLEIFAVMYVACVLGVTVGYHRMLTHRAFQANPVVKFILLAFGSMSGMGPASTWAITHIQHHAHADDEGDPHSPWDWAEKVQRIRKTGLRRFFWAHLLWIVKGDKVPVDQHGQWLLRDPMVRFVSHWAVCWGLAAVGFVAPFLLDGWRGLVWGGAIRMGLGHHMTWSINSVCHVYGKRPYDTPDCSRNNWVCAVLGLGEGWHNNHHAFPRSAFHGLRWWQIDLGGYVIRAMELTGMARNVWRVPTQSLGARSRGSR